MYGSAFCRVYNEFGWNVYPEVFAEQLWTWLERRGAAVRSMLDLGCGTGVLCAAMARRGVRAAGVDLAEGMLRIARQQAPDCAFALGDMTRYRPAERVDLITCTGDAVNHVFDLGDVGRMFENVSASLVPGGLFVFDLLRQSEIPDDEPFTLDYSDSVRGVFRTTRESGGVINLHIEVFENGARKVSEDIRERLHDPEAVCAMLEAAGLKVFQRGDNLLPDTGVHGATWIIAAEKK